MVPLVVETNDSPPHLRPLFLSSQPDLVTQPGVGGGAGSGHGVRCSLVTGCRHVSMEASSPYS